MKHLIIGLVLTIIMLGIYRLFGKLFPLDGSDFRTNKTFKELRKEYLKFDIAIILALIVMIITITSIFFNLLTRIARFRITLLTDVIISIMPQKEMLLIASLFSGILISSFIMFHILKWQLEDEWTEYLAYTNMKYKFNYIKVTYYSVRFFAIITILLVLASLDCFYTFGKDKINLNTITSIGSRTYSYSQIKEIQAVQKIKAPNGDIISDPYFAIKFLDGEIWNSRDNGFENYKENVAVINLVCEKTKLNPQVLEFEK